MPRETIILISSSPGPPAPARAPTAAINKTLSPPAPPLIQQTQVTTAAAQTTGWVEISSDSEADALPTRPVFDRGKTITSTHAAKIPFSGILPPLSSDDDPYSLPALPLKASAATSSVQDVHNSKALKRDRDFYFLSEDFDTTIDADRSVNEPDHPTKKPRNDVSSAAKMAGAAALRRLDSNTTRKDVERDQAQVPAVREGKAAGRKRILESDPIDFTSSPDPYLEAARKKAAKRKALPMYDGADILLDISSDPPLSSDIDPLPSAPKSKAKPRVTEWEKYEADRQKEKQKALKSTEKRKKVTVTSEDKEKKAAEREVEREKKRLAKEDKAREREERTKEKARAAELAKVNTLRTDKKVSAPEMIVDLPSSLEEKLRLQTEGLLEGFNIEHRSWNNDLPVVKFRRKVDAKYNDDLGLWEPVPLHIKDEKHIIYVMTSQELVERILNDKEDNDFDAFILRLKVKFQHCQIVMLVQGYNIFIRKNRNLKNRQFTQAVRAVGSHVEEAAPSASQRRKKKEAQYVDEDLLEDAMLKLQTVHELLVHHTNVHQETAEQIAVFTQQISTIPYKSQKQPSNATFCMETGQVKTGDGPTDTYIKMLQEIVRLTAPIAYGIQAKYPTLVSLIEGCLKEGPTVVEECRKSANKDGAFTDRKIGPAISKRVWRVFTGRDVNSIDV